MATWKQDTASSEISFAFVHLAVHFSVRHVVEHPLRGVFEKSTLQFRLDEDQISTSTIEFLIDVDSLRTGNSDGDARLRAADAFDLKRFRSITFRSGQITRVKPGRYRVVGDIGMRGVVRPVTWDLEQTICEIDSSRATFAGRISVDPADVGMVCESGISGGSISDRLEIHLRFPATTSRH